VSDPIEGLQGCCKITSALSVWWGLTLWSPLICFGNGDVSTKREGDVTSLSYRRVTFTDQGTM